MKLNHFQKKICLIKFLEIVLLYLYSLKNEEFSSLYYSLFFREIIWPGFNYWYNYNNNPLKRIVYFHITRGRLAYISIKGKLIR